MQMGLLCCSIIYIAGLPIYLSLFPEELHGVIFWTELPVVMLPLWLLTFSYFYEVPLLSEVRSWLAAYVYLAAGICHAVFNTLNHKYGTPMVGDILPMIFLFGCLFCGLNTKQAGITSGIIFLSIVSATLWADYAWPIVVNQFAQWLFFIAVILFTNYQSQIMLRKVYDYQKELKNKSSTDSLTGLLNRSALDEHFAVLRRQSVRENKAFCLLIIDLDYFKELNDGHGHLEGDQALVTIANILQSSARRPLDCACRWGGDEFIIIFYDVVYEDISEMCRLIKERLQYSAINNPMSEFNGHQTITIGGILGKLGHLTDREIINLADLALYEAKQEGRNTHLIHTYNTSDRNKLNNAKTENNLADSTSSASESNCR